MEAPPTKPFPSSRAALNELIRRRLEEIPEGQDGQRAEAAAYLQGCLNRFWATLQLLAKVIPPQAAGPRPVVRPPLAAAASCSVLDLGTFPGQITLAIKELFGCRVTGMTAVTSPAFEQQMSRCGIPIHLHDLERHPLPFDPGSFDIVLCLDLIEHLTYNVPFVLEESSRVLKAGGTLILTTPNLASVWNRWDLLRGRPIGKPLEDPLHPFYGFPPVNGGPLPDWIAMRHVRELTGSELRFLLKRSGFPTPQIRFLRFPMNFSPAGLSLKGMLISWGLQGLEQIAPALRASLVAIATKP